MDESECMNKLFESVPNVVLKIDVTYICSQFCISLHLKDGHHLLTVFEIDALLQTSVVSFAMA